MEKKKELHGHFKRSNYFDNGTKVDQFGCILTSTKEKKDIKNESNYSTRS